MERDKEIVKLTNVLHRIARAAGYAAWANAAPDAARFCASQYNKVLARLEVLEPAAKPLFTPLPESTSPQVIRMAAGELAAYFDDEAGSEDRVRHRARHCGGRRARAGVIVLGRC
ncbi:MAG TPA: hypothetical protein VJX74_02485 [Blastocatellia bacterium]|nr:hypothetical protein [Blastocatellia bacterium]